jgi:uncharacterized protein (DUF305 family)
VTRARGRLLIAAVLLGQGYSAHAEARWQAPIIQPGAPGEAPRLITPREATDLSRVRHTRDDVRFMQGMIGHHAQALEMTALRAARSSSDALRRIALRIELSQVDEIALMEGWLKARGEPLPDRHAHHMPGAQLMPGMLTQEEMSKLSAARGAAFDRLFLELMIKHHQGAVVMVDALFATPGAGQEPDIFAFASDIVDDQSIEIARMSAMLQELKP